MSKYKKCPNGHFYQGDVCPYCETELFPIGSYRTRSDVEHTSVAPPYRETETSSIPLCPHCGRPVRKGMPHSDFPIIGSIEGNAYDGRIPWNYNWDGKCENCGYDFSISMHQKIHTGKDRYTTVRVSVRRIERDLSDDLIGLSGVEIEQRNSIDGVKKTFISTNELKYLINALKDSPLLEQMDWYEDRT